MSVKPDYEAAAEKAEELLQGAYAWDIMPAPLARAIVDAALGNDLSAFAVAALIAEGGEKVWLCVDERANGERALWGAALDNPVQIENCWFGGWQKHSPRCGWHLATPIPAEEETTT